MYILVSSKICSTKFELGAVFNFISEMCFLDLILKSLFVLPVKNVLQLYLCLCIISSIC
jgi:hypothetical protein